MLTLFHPNATKPRLALFVPLPNSLGACPRFRILGLVASFFNWRREAAPLDPIRHYKYFNFPRITAPTTPARPPAQVSSSRVPVSPSTTEMLLGIAARLPGVTLLSIWEINDRTLVLFTCQRVCGSTLALDINLFDRAHIKTKVEEAAARFEHRE